MQVGDDPHLVFSSAAALKDLYRGFDDLVRGMRASKQRFELGVAVALADRGDATKQGVGVGAPAKDEVGQAGEPRGGDGVLDEPGFAHASRARNNYGTAGLKVALQGLEFIFASSEREARRIGTAAGFRDLGSLRRSIEFDLDGGRRQRKVLEKLFSAGLDVRDADALEQPGKRERVELLCSDEDRRLVRRAGDDVRDLLDKATSAGFGALAEEAHVLCR